MNIKESLCIYSSCDSAVTKSVNPAPRKYGPWARQLYVLIYVYKGKGYLEVGGKSYEITEGQSFLVFPGVTVTYWADVQDEWQYYWADFNGDLAKEFAEKMSFSLEHPVLYATETNIPDKFRALVAASVYKDESTAIDQLSAFMGLAAEYMRQYGNVSVKQKNLMEDIVAYIGTNFSDPTLTPDSLAEHFGLSRTALYRLFSEKLGTSPKKHINNIRIENACTILHRNDRQIKEIALSVGFNNPLYFSKVFKERNGVSPSEYTEYFKNVLA